MTHSLEDRTPRRSTQPLLARPLEENDPVMLPSGRKAIVLKRLDDDRVECQYLGGSPRDTVVISAHLARLIRPGVPTPPARVPRIRR